MPLEGGLEIEKLLSGKPIKTPFTGTTFPFLACRIYSLLRKFRVKGNN